MTGKDRCDGCKWLGRYYYPNRDGKDQDVWCCDYCFMTGVPRGISKDECYKHEGTPYKKGDPRGNWRTISKKEKESKKQ